MPDLVNQKLLYLLQIKHLLNLSTAPPLPCYLTPNSGHHISHMSYHNLQGQHLCIVSKIVVFLIEGCILVLANCLRSDKDFIDIY